MQIDRMNVRFPADQSLWLRTRAKENSRSVNAEILDAIREAIKRDPLLIYVHECAAPDGRFFTASIGKHGDDFYEGPSREEAFAAALKKARELGLSRSTVRIETEDFTGEPAHA
ncbi:Arc family DNA-binding protein [Phyllobacterium phragmitis]|uniref:Arc-like DNA binding domain-containing protein n=1 Tax=Phyllobacterium phragmitis TaxID=2670329 RepID=A0ABQ0GYH2_9HYPH